MPLSALIDSAMDAIISTDEHQHIIIFNGAAELMFGYRADQVIGGHLDMLIPHRHRAHHRKNVDDFGRTGVTTRTMNMPGSSYGLRADGEEFLFEASISKVDVEGRLIYTAILRDITSRRLLESALKLNEARLSQAVDIAGVGFFDYDKVSEEMYWSPQMRAIFGVSPDEPVNMHTLLDSVFPADREKLLAALDSVQSAVGDGCFVLSYRMLRRDGEMRWLAVQMHISFAGSDESRYAKRTVGAVRDITRRIASEEALQLASSVYQSSHEGILVTDENNLIVDINPAFTELTGYTLDEVRGKNPNIFQSGMHGPAFYQEMWQSIQDAGHWQGEMWDKRRDGVLHAKWISISAIRHPDGSLFRYVAQFTDISEKKRRDELIWTQANFDALTSLPNRRLLNDRLGQSMAAVKRSKHYCALMFIDLDKFKALNDTLSQSRANAVLEYLKQKFPQLPASQFTAKGYGFSAPVAPNTTDLGRAKNRRVEFKVLNTEALRIEREKRRFLQKNEAAPPDSMPMAPPSTPAPPDTTKR